MAKFASDQEARDKEDAERRKQDEEARQKHAAEQEALRKKEAEERQKAAEAQKKANEEVERRRKQSEEEAARKVKEAEEAAKKAKEDADKRIADAKKKAEEVARQAAEAKKKAEEEAKRKAEAARKAEEARKAAEEAERRKVKHDYNTNVGQDVNAILRQNYRNKREFRASDWAATQAKVNQWHQRILPWSGWRHHHTRHHIVRRQGNEMNAYPAWRVHWARPKWRSFCDQNGLIQKNRFYDFIRHHRNIFALHRSNQ